MPVRAIFRRALVRGEVAINPTTGLELPAVRGRRDRIASPEEAATLLATLDRDRAMWATAMYAGLRLGELLALDWSAGRPGRRPNSRPPLVGSQERALSRQSLALDRVRRLRRELARVALRRMR